jgi:hypothetical protein
MQFAVVFGVFAIPPRLEVAPEPQLTGVSCPDCGGSLSVESEGKRADLVFRCRIGHTYSLTELLVAKEERLHAQLWTAYTALMELQALLHDLAVREASEDDTPLTLPADGEPS